jgi:hypothetical protein
MDYGKKYEGRPVIRLKQPFSSSTEKTDNNIFFISNMPWGTKKNVDDLVARIASNDPLLTSLCVLTSTRTVDSSSCIQISEALRSNTVLKELLLSGHKVGAQGAAAMSEALSGPTGNHTLCMLRIGSQQFSDDGVNALASHLGQWNFVNDLDLELKNLGPQGVTNLGTSLAANTSIHSLTLARNPLADEGILALLSHMYGDAHSNGSLTSLSRRDGDWLRFHRGIHHESLCDQCTRDAEAGSQRRDRRWLSDEHCVDAVAVGKHEPAPLALPVHGTMLPG